MATELFSSKDQRDSSSTLRERIAQIAAVDDLHPLFQGPIVVVNDNQNSKKEWHDVSRLFIGRLADEFVRFQQHVHFSVWMNREAPLPTMVDLLARVREDLTSARQKRKADSLSQLPAIQSASGTVSPTPPQSGNTPIPLPPPVPFDEPLPMDNFLFNNLSSRFPDFYLADRSQTHNGVNIADIC